MINFIKKLLKKKRPRIIKEYKKILKYKKMIKFVYQNKPLRYWRCSFKNKKIY